MSENNHQVAYGYHASAVWLNTLSQVMLYGADVAPRDQATRELPQHTIEMRLDQPLVLCPERGLAVRFAAAEALWIIDGSNALAPLVKHAPRMAEFSDDGVTLAGAYGPRVTSQLDYVVAKLLTDRDTRQATLTTWVPNPPPSKDIPCTIAMDFKIRSGKLNCHVFMRSSDIWLGLPYDVFSFAMIATYVACRYNAAAEAPPVPLGRLYLTAASSHLYAANLDGARRCVKVGLAPQARPVPEVVVARGDWPMLRKSLRQTRETGAALWENVS